MPWNEDPAEDDLLTEGGLVVPGCADTGQQILLIIPDPAQPGRLVDSDISVTWFSVAAQSQHST